MRVAPDGSPVELYRRLPERTAEVRLIDKLLGRPSEILDLGCGTGRVAEPLSRAGHKVVGVDNELSAVVRYEFDGASAEQRFRVREVDDAMLNGLAADAGLRMGAVFDETSTLVSLYREPDHTP